MNNIIRLPGLIDVHVHLREPGATHKEDFESGTKAAIAGGYTTIIDMPNNPEPTITSKALEKKIQLSKKHMFCDLGFHYGASHTNFDTFNSIQGKVFGLKIYMNHTTGTLLLEDENELDMIFKSWPGSQPILVHAEADTLRTAIALAEKYKKRLHVCHVSLAEEVDIIKKAKKNNIDITAEVTCHHLFLTKDDVSKKGNLVLMKPQLATKNDQNALWEGLKSGIIDMIASDHAPHTVQEKRSDSPPYGVPGLETSLPLLYTAVEEGRLSLDQLIKITSTTPAKIFNIKQNKQTYTELNKDSKYKISSHNLITKCGWSPFDGMAVKGKVSKVVLRGTVVYDNGRFISPPIGTYVVPSTI